MVLDTAYRYMGTLLTTSSEGLDIIIRKLTHSKVGCNAAEAYFLAKRRYFLELGR